VVEKLEKLDSKVGRRDAIVIFKRLDNGIFYKADDDGGRSLPTKDKEGNYRIGNFRPKNNSADSGIGGTMVISDVIPVVPRKRKSRNSVPNPSAEEKTTRNSILWNKK
jgi:hypothetical protein